MFKLAATVSLSSLIFTALSAPAAAEDLLRIGECGTLYVTGTETSEVCNPLLEPLGGTSVEKP